jgi:SIR2-like domain
MSSTPYDLADVQFFNQQDALTAIGNLAAVDDLVIFCGAGLTIDHTGKSWGQLVLDVLADRSKIPDLDLHPADAEVIAQVLSPLHLASLASHYLRENADDESKKEDALHTTLRNHLYSLSDWSAGGLVDNVARLALARAVRGLGTRLVTTNYETTLEERYQSQLSVAGSDDPSEPQAGLCVEVVGEEGVVQEILPRNGAGVVCLTYLHGRVPSKGDIRGKIAFSERDYWEVRQTVEECLVSLFTQTNVLILGSSLTDPPLMNALMTTADLSEERPFSRIAIFPMQSVATSGGTLSEEQGAAVAAHLPARMKEFGVDLLMPDFFSQVAQFVEEVRIQTLEANRDEWYDRRLERWWAEWKPLGEDWKFQVMFHNHLAEVVEDIRAHFGRARRSAARDDESLKLEVWVRVPIGNRRRSLQLWAASSAVVTDVSNPRWASLSIATTFAAVEAYQAGRPLLKTLEGELKGPIRDPRDGRWKTFLSVPIAITDESGSLPVGVVTLASSLGRSSSLRSAGTRIRENRPKAMRSVIALMRDVGEIHLAERSGRQLLDDDARSAPVGSNE